MSWLRRASRVTLTGLLLGGALGLTGCAAWTKPSPTLVLTSVPECPVDPALREPVRRPIRPELGRLSEREALFLVLGFSLQQEAAISVSEGRTQQAVATQDQCNANARALTKQIEESRQGWLRRVLPW